MKIFIILVLAFAFASANQSPVWKQCGNMSDVFTPKSVTAQKDPKNDTLTLVSACGTVNSHGVATIFNRLIIDQDFGFARLSENLSYKKVVPSGSDFCLNYTEAYAKYGSVNVSVQITASNVKGEEAGCVSFTLQLPVTDSRDSGFLMKRLERI